MGRYALSNNALFTTPDGAITDPPLAREPPKLSGSRTPAAAPETPLLKKRADEARAAFQHADRAPLASPPPSHESRASQAGHPDQAGRTNKRIRTIGSIASGLWRCFSFRTPSGRCSSTNAETLPSIPPAKQESLDQVNHRRNTNIYRGHGAKQARRSARRKALLVTANYTPRGTGGSTEPLDSTARDSIRFQKCLEKLGFEETDAIVVHGANGGSVAEDSFMQGLDMLFFEVQDDDVLVLLVSMHAILESGSVYLAFERNDRSVARVGTRELVEKINAKLGDVCCTVEIVFDTCFAAGLIKCPHIIRQMAPNSANGPEVIKDEPLALRAKQAPNQLAAYNDLGVRIAEENPSSLGDRLCTPHLHTRSVIIVWAAAEINQRAYECKFDGSGGGALITAICEAVETHGIVSRQKVFDDSVQ
ncbi:hypothetical protein RhiLY_11584 [Ceratobasidium sp. AG-Ba]|nr:hypothetical protein RhiLY_11584 [Ceratobasidium sp. AG-Ba]